MEISNDTLSQAKASKSVLKSIEHTVKSKEFF